LFSFGSPGPAPTAVTGPFYRRLAYLDYDLLLEHLIYYAGVFFSVPSKTVNFITRTKAHDVSGVMRFTAAQDYLSSQTGVRRRVETVIPLFP